MHIQIHTIGRASVGPVLDLFITLLSMGSTGYMELLKQREENFIYMKGDISADV